MRRVQQFTTAIEPIGDSKADWQILRDLANELDHTWRYHTTAEVFADLAANVPAYKDLSFAKLSGRQYRSRLHFLYEGTSFQTHGDGGAVYASAAENPDTKFDLKFTSPGDARAKAGADLLLVAPRVLYDAGTLIRETELLHHVTPASYAEFSRADAERFGLKDGERVRLSTSMGSVEATARVDGRAPTGVVVAPMNLAPADTRALLAPREVATAVTVERL